GDEFLQRGNVHVSLEGMLQAGLLSLGDRKIQGLCADKFNIGASGIKVGVVGDNVTLLAGNAEQDSLRRPSLVCWDHVPIAEYFLYRVFKADKALAASVAFVAF